MASYRDPTTSSDRAKAIVAVVAVHAGLGALILSGSPTLPDAIDRVRTVLIDVEPPPPPPPPEPDPGRAREEEGAAGKKAEPTPVVAPPPRVEVPAKSPIPAAPVPGTGSSAIAGAASAGSGPGAGGSGLGRGGGGSGGGIGVQARLLGGNRTKLPSRMLRPFAADRGYAHLWLTVADTGRVTDCKVLQGTGVAEVDQALCALMIRKSQWSAARNTEDRPITVQVRYTATWSKD